MKTNQEMIRPMGKFNVIQRTKDGMFNATDLLRQWNANTGEKKEIFKFFDNDNTKQFIDALMIEEKLNTQDSAYLKSRGKNRGTWMHPILFIKFAMWLNPRFEVQVIKFVYDQMIHFRNEAGDAYRELSSAIAKIVSKSFMPQAMRKVGEALNWIIFDQHERMIRNKQGEESKQRDLWMLEKKVADLINEGFISDFDSLITYLRKVWHNRNTPKVLIP